MKTIVSSLLFAFAVSAAAAPVALIDAGKLVGADGVIVDGVSYDVRFVDGSCDALFSGCDPTRFTFRTEQEAQAASQALLDQVFLDTSAAGLVDTHPELIRGCGWSASCGVRTVFDIFGLTNSQGVVVQWQYRFYAANNGGIGSLSGDFASGPHAEVTSRDETGNDRSTFALWTRSSADDPRQLPEPSVLGLSGVALALLALVRRRKAVAPRA